VQAKVEFKKDHGFSPDRFDAAIHTFLKDDPISEVIIPKEQVETMEFGRFIQQSARVKHLSLLAPCKGN
jgi:hypothetical protein